GLRPPGGSPTYEVKQPGAVAQGTWRPGHPGSAGITGWVRGCSSLLGVPSTRLESAGGASISDQPSGKAAKSRLVFLYHPIPLMGFFHRPFISFKALSCVVSPLATIS